MAAVNIRRSRRIYAPENTRTFLLLVEKALTDCGSLEPSGVGDLLRNSLDDDIDMHA